MIQHFSSFKDFLLDHRLMVVLLVMGLGFAGFIATQKPASTYDKDKQAFIEVDSSSPMSRGDKQAKVSLIQYSDFLCPSCSYFSTQIMPEVDSEYIDQGKIKFEFRPMAFIAEGSRIAGMGAYCAIDQQKFWSYHDVIYTYVAQKVLSEGVDPKSSTILTTPLVEQLAQSAGLSAEQFNSCLESGKHAADITNATKKANQNGVTGTPFIMVNGQHYQGNMSKESVMALIKASL
jgi:protein-disulfide isomerase